MDQPVKSWADEAEKEGEGSSDPTAAALADKLSGLSTNDATASEPSHLLKETEENTKIVVTPSGNRPLAPIYAAVSKFEELNLKPELLQGIYAKGWSRPSKIQEVSMPLILNDPPQNVIAQAQSGTGKTAAFTLGMLSRIDPAIQAPQALCVCHTRELARQNFEVLTALGKFLTGVSAILVVPQEKLPPQITQQIIIGTPGTILDCIKNRSLDLKRLQIFVLDEADVMLDTQGLGDQTIRLKGVLTQRKIVCQMLLFSATYSDKVVKFSEQIVPPPSVSIRLERKDESLDAITQYYVEVTDENAKFNMLSDLYSYLTIGQSIIFVNRRDTSQNLANKMTAAGHAVSQLSGELRPEERDKVLDEFRHGRTKVLITTNVMARGIDIPAITLVINYDLPVEQSGRADYATYLHRIGRTGRFGHDGIAINFIHNEASRRIMTDIANHYQRPITHLKQEDIPSLDEKLQELKNAL